MYELYVRLPKSYVKGERQYPLVLLNDTSYSIATASGIVHLMERRDIEDVILVGISYSIGDDPLISRTRDYTPTYAPKETNGHSLEAQKHSGKAKQYMHFIAEEVLPLLNKNYRINNNKTVFVGHSFGGLLGANILLNMPELFDHYILGSPSLYYDNKVTFRLEDAYAKKHDSMKANVYMFVGGEEKWMVDDMLEFDARLKSRKYKGLNIQSKVLDGLTHFSSFGVLLTLGLQQSLPRI
ncbi:alpha/beta hydrolase [Pseudoalteromonas sp. A25]|uniref:alpha/beta hydrolase n=1 Tax=Pseudoalteromonas sp. A25 TaxID=116092 RepID=UPI001E5C7CB6|nr:alpha/beta hydrolase-fold protein [Pseudoalteromonas sp. A25]